MKEEASILLYCSGKIYYYLTRQASIYFCVETATEIVLQVAYKFPQAVMVCF